MVKIDRKQLWHIWAIIALVGLVAITYGPLIHGYFATDEWWAFAYAISQRNLREVLQLSGVYAPLANLFIYVLYHGFGLNAAVWAGLAISFHLANTVLLYLTIYRVSQNRAIALITAALFTILPMGAQFVDQFSMMPTSGIGTFLAMLALFAYSHRKAGIATILLAIGFGFTPYILPFIFFMALIEIVYFRKKDWRQSFKRLSINALVVGLYLVVQHRTTLQSNGLHDRPANGESHLLGWLLHAGQKLYQSYAELLLNPQGTISPVAMLQASHAILVIAIALIGLMILKKRYDTVKLQVIAILWIPASVSLFSTLNTVAIDGAMPSRYFYMSTVGIGLFIGATLTGFFDQKVRDIRVGELLTIVALALIAQSYIPKQQGTIAGEVSLGQTRKMIMDSIDRSVPHPLHREALFCFTSNTSNYGSPFYVIPLPFVHNFAFNMAVRYRAKDSLLHDFFTESGIFLNPTASFYYYARDQRDPDGIGPGIGFATNPETCKNVKDQHGHLGLADIYGFAYDGNKPQLIDISGAMREYVAGKVVPQKALFPW